MNDFTDVTSALRQIAESDRLVSLTNEFKGVPVSSAATVQRFDEAGRLVVSVSPEQAVCLASERTTTMQSAVLSLAFTGRVAEVSMASRTAVLEGLAYTFYVPQARREIRVRPLEPIQSLLSVSGRTLTCDVQNISAGGVGVLVPQAQIDFEPSSLLERGLDVQAELRLPPLTDVHRLAGQIAYARPGLGGWLVGVNLSDDPQARVSLGAYATGRRDGVMPELTALHAEMLQKQ